LNCHRVNSTKAFAQLCTVLSALVWFSATARSATQPIDESKLPPPATNKIDFARDIKPIFDASCIRCHGPAKPKSGFRLDNRAAALKGGDDGVDIVLGNSAKSPLIHFTAQLVEDLEMPPTGKGDPLTPAQIALLRAWIDQGALWSADALTNFYSVSLSPIFGGTDVHGDKQKFRELNWRREGNYVGVDDFEVFQQNSSDTALLLNGHAVQDDYKISLSVQRSDIGFFRSGWEQYRKYYDNTGGFLPGATPVPALSLDQDLFLDVGKAWVDLGLTLPQWPRMVFGYEYDYRTGNEAVTAWQNNHRGAASRNVAPASKNINEGTHVIKFDLNAEVKGMTIEDRFRGEFYGLNTHYTNLSARGNAGQYVAQKVTEKNTYFQGANSIVLQKQFNDWFYGSGGYFYSHLDADSSFTNVTILGARSFFGSMPDISLERESHVANLNALFGPWEGWTFSGGAQTEWTHQQGFGTGALNQFAFTRSMPNTLIIVPTTLRGNYNDNSVKENLALRYTKIPFTILFAEGRLEQRSVGQTDVDLQPQPSGNYVEKVAFSSQLSDFRAGFSTSPWRWMSLSAHYRRYQNDSRYPLDAPAQPSGGYPGFFKSRDLLTDEIETKLVVRPCNWLKTTLSYQHLTTDYRDNANTGSNSFLGVFSPGGRLLTGRTESQRYTFGAVVTPHPRIYFTGSFTYEPSRTRSANSDAATVGQYRGDTYSADASSTYVLSATTDFSVGWVFSEANYGQANRTAAPPVDMRYQEHGIDAALTRRFSQSVSARLQYAFDYYHDPGSRNANDFRAHTVFAVLNFRLP
jgi:mono/diheme cytochrome c family protein